MFGKTKISKETSREVDKDAVNSKKDGLMKQAFNKVTEGLTHVAKFGAKCAFGYGVGKLAINTAKNIYEEATGNTVSYHGPFSSEGFGVDVTQSNRNVVHVREDASNVIEQPIGEEVATEMQ